MHKTNTDVFFDLDKIQGEPIGHPSNPFYRTTNQEYQPKWAMTQNATTKDYTIPPFDEINKHRQDYYNCETTLRTKILHGELALKNTQDSLSQYEKLKQQGLRNAIRSKPFPFEPTEFKYPSHAHNMDNPLYATSNTDYGKLLPSGYEVNERWYPRNTLFTQSLPGGTYRNNSLRTEMTNSKVNNYLDGFN